MHYLFRNSLKCSYVLLLALKGGRNWVIVLFLLKSQLKIKVVGPGVASAGEQCVEMEFKLPFVSW